MKKWKIKVYFSFLVLSPGVSQEASGGGDGDLMPQFNPLRLGQQLLWKHSSGFRLSSVRVPAMERSLLWLCISLNDRLGPSFGLAAAEDLCANTWQLYTPLQSWFGVLKKLEASWMCWDLHCGGVSKGGLSWALVENWVSMTCIWQCP